MWQTCMSGSCCRRLRPTERASPVPVPCQALQLTSPPNARSVQVNSSSWPVCGLRLAAAVAAAAAVVPGPPAAAPHVQTVAERANLWLIVREAASKRQGARQAPCQRAPRATDPQARIVLDRVCAIKWICLQRLSSTPLLHL